MGKALRNQSFSLLKEKKRVDVDNRGPLQAIGRPHCALESVETWEDRWITG